MNATCQFDTAHLRHVDVRQHQINFLTVGRVDHERLQAVRRLEYIVAFLFQNHCRDVTDALVVVNYKDCSHTASSFRRPAEMQVNEDQRYQRGAGC